jgi:hypothetical protein
VDTGLCQSGVEQRTCDATCQWPAWGACEGEVPPAAEVCGNDADEDCDGTAARRPDMWEPNDACDRCWPLTGLDPDVTLDATSDAVDDARDYYCFDTDDGAFAGFFNERVRVTLENVPAGMDLDIFLYEDAAACRAENALASSIAGGQTDESIDWPERFNHDDGGRYIVEVRRYGTPACDARYRLHVDGLR